MKTSTMWIIAWKHRRNTPTGESLMEDTLASTRREAWRKCFKWYTEGHVPGSDNHLEFAKLYYSRRDAGTHRAVKVTISKVSE